MFQRLNHNKKVFEKEVTTMIPISASMVLQINKDKKSNSLTHLFGKLGVMVDSIQASLTYPIYFVNENDNLGIVAKITVQQENKLRNKLDEEIFPEYPPKVKIYKDAEIRFYATADNSFFCCTFYNGVFIGSYSYKIIEQSVDANSDNNFFTNSQFTDILPQIKTTYIANLYYNDADNWSAFNISLDENSVVLDGFADSKNSNLLSDPLTNGEFIIDRTILPNALLAYQVNTSKSEISDSLRYQFSTPCYHFYTDTTATPIYALKLDVDRFVVYNYLNSLEMEYIGRKFGTNNFAFGNQRIYTASPQLSSFIFDKKEIVYLTFYKNYLIYCTDKQILVSYLSNNGKNETDTIPNIINDDNTQIESIFYSSNPKNTIIHPLALKDFDLLKSSNKKKISIKTYRENNIKKSNIILSN